MKLRIKSTIFTLQIIGCLQIIGGITGIGLIAYLMLKTGTVNGGLLLIFLIGLSLYSFSIYSGKRLLTDENKNIGIILSIINQAFQVIQCSLYGYELTYSSGADLSIGIQEMAFKFNIAAITSKFQMAINSNDVFFVKVNLIAILVLITLVDIFDELKKKKNEIAKIEVNKLDVE